jgi:hypothetical protein
MGRIATQETFYNETRFLWTERRWPSQARRWIANSVFGTGANIHCPEGLGGSNPPLRAFLLARTWSRGVNYCKRISTCSRRTASAISQMMGHSTTKTTEGHHGRIRNDRALDEIEKAWESRSAVAKQDTKGPMAGYA